MRECATGGNWRAAEKNERLRGGVVVDKRGDLGLARSLAVLGSWLHNSA